MKSNSWRTILRLGGMALLAAITVSAQQHRWAGRTLDDREWEIHERLAALPAHGVFDNINFAVSGDTVTLTGQVVKESVKHNAERSVRRVSGITGVVNHIDVLPSSRRDDAIRKNVYRAIYENAPLDKYGTHQSPPVHIIVKNEWVTLEGVVDSQEDRSAVHLRVLQLTPHVTDHVRVAEEGF